MGKRNSGKTRLLSTDTTGRLVFQSTAVQALRPQLPLKTHPLQTLKEAKLKASPMLRTNTPRIEYYTHFPSIIENGGRIGRFAHHQIHERHRWSCSSEPRDGLHTARLTVRFVLLTFPAKFSMSDAVHDAGSCRTIGMHCPTRTDVHIYRIEGYLRVHSLRVRVRHNSEY